MSRSDSSLASTAITPAAGPIHAVVTVPGSKSITNRALLVASLAEGRSVLSGALFSDDTRYMSQALTAAGVGLDADPERCEFRVEGKGGPPGLVDERQFVGNAGTAMRFLTSYFALGPGSIVLDGSPRMRERPIQELIDALNSLGARVKSEAANGCPPVMIEGGGLAGGETSMPGHRSSQFASSLLLSAPYARSPVILRIVGKLASLPYLDLTTDVMAAFGVSTRNNAYVEFEVQPGMYTGRQYAIEPDASAASYFLAAAAITGGGVTVRGLSTTSRQGDIQFARVLEQMGCQLEDTPAGLALTGSGSLQGVDVDMGGFSDVALTLAAVAPFCETPTHIRGVGHMRLQETDRIHAIVTELNRAGIQTEEREDGFSIYPGKPRPTAFHTYDDHRMAMSMALIGLRTPGCEVLEPGCVSKTFPDYFNRLAGLIN